MSCLYHGPCTRSWLMNRFSCGFHGLHTNLSKTNYQWCVGKEKIAIHQQLPNRLVLDHSNKLFFVTCDERGSLLRQGGEQCGKRGTEPVGSDGAAEGVSLQTSTKTWYWPDQIVSAADSQTRYPHPTQRHHAHTPDADTLRASCWRLSERLTR